MKKIIIPIFLVLGLSVFAISNISAVETERLQNNTEINTDSILFNNLSNNATEYDVLKEANTSFANENFKKTKESSNINEAGEYVDSDVFTSKNTISFIENETIYFDNSLLTQFINENGDTKVVASKYDTANDYAFALNSSSIKTSSNLDDIFVKNENTTSNKDMDYINDFDYQPFLVTEETYLNDLTNIIFIITKTPFENIDENIKNKLDAYFADNCYELFNKGKELSDKVSLSADFVLAGKSDISLNYKDRILMQITATEDEKKASTCLLFKLDENNKIYSINILVF